MYPKTKYKLLSWINSIHVVINRAQNEAKVLIHRCMEIQLYLYHHNERQSWSFVPDVRSGQVSETLGSIGTCVACSFGPE